MEVPSIIYTSGDLTLIDTIVGQLKSQGIFDQFRKECVADVDTKPAYQNLHQRVETAVAKFLEGQTWRPDLNKNQLRDSLRKHIHELGFLETGVERIVDQVVNPKVHAVFMPQVEDVVYRVQGLPKPEKKTSSVSTPSGNLGSSSKNGGIFSSSLFSHPPPFFPGLSFLPPSLQTHMQKPLPTLADLLPTDLDPVSPESSKESFAEVEEEKKPPLSREHEESLDSQLSGFSELTSHGSEHDPTSKRERGHTPVPQTINEDSHLSKVSSNSRLSFISSDEKSHGPKDKEIEEMELQANQQATNGTDMQMPAVPLFPHGNDTVVKTSSHEPPEGSIIHYEDQFSKEEEVATTVTDPGAEIFTACSQSSEDCAPGTPLKDEKLNGEAERTIIDNNKSCYINEEEENLNRSQEQDTHGSKHHLPGALRTDGADDNFVHQSEESQSSGTSDNKLHIDELKDSNSQSQHTPPNYDQNSVKGASLEEFEGKENSENKLPSESIVEASEEARHGFDDSQDALDRPPLPPPLPVLATPPVPPSGSPSHTSHTSFPCEEDSLPKTPRWEPMSPENHGSEFATASKALQDETFSLNTLPKEENEKSPVMSKSHLELEEISQSESEDMQLVWSPLSVHDKDEEDSGSKYAFIHDNNPDQNVAISLNDEGIELKSKPSKENSSDSRKKEQAISDDKHDEHQDNLKLKDKSRDDKGWERSNDRSRKDSSSSSRRHSSKRKDSRERKDSSSRSKHDDRNRSDRDRDRSSSHHKSDDKRREDKERSSSLKHKSSRSEERHRHKERDGKTSSSSRSRDRERDKSKGDDKGKVSSKSHSSDRDRRDRDKKDRDIKDKDRDRPGKESSKHSEKRREKERGKEKKDKSNNACKPSNERRSPDPDSNNGSMFGGAPSASSSFHGINQVKDGVKDNSNKGPSSNDSDSKSGDSNQNKEACAELASTVTQGESTSPPSSLPFKKRPLHPDKENTVGESYGRLILRIKKAKLEPNYYRNRESRKSDKAVKKLDAKCSTSELSGNPPCQIDNIFNTPPTSPLKYFENDWPAKSANEAFCLFVRRLEQQQTLSELSDYSESNNEEMYLCPRDPNKSPLVEGPSTRLSLSLVTESQANEFMTSQNHLNDIQGMEERIKTKRSKTNLNAALKTKNRSKQRNIHEFGEPKRRKGARTDNLRDFPAVFKSRRERKPNKRYSNDEFTSNFGYDEDEVPGDYGVSLPKTHTTPSVVENNTLTNSENVATSTAQRTHDDVVHSKLQRRKEDTCVSVTESSPFKVQKAEISKDHNRMSQSWNTGGDNSNSEDENVAAGYENELIGTALKNLMMESGLGGPEEASGSDNFSGASQICQNPSRCGTTRREQPLSGVKRVGLSRNYKGKASLATQTKNKIASSQSSGSEEFPLPLSPESDVSASSFEKGRVGKIRKGISS